VLPRVSRRRRGAPGEEKADDMTDLKDKTTRYFVNGEAQTTTEDKLTPRQILADAGFTPVEEYRLTRDDGNKVLEDYDKPESIHKDERFTVTFLGPTPTS
jgi:hypothetical protein